MRRLLQRFRGPEDDTVTDEQILNVFRRADEPILKTADVADQLPIGDYWTNKRLQELEEKGRVHSKSAGQGNVWTIDDAEATFPVREGIGDILWYVSTIKRASTYAFLLAFGLFAVAGIFALLLFVSYNYPDFFFQFYSDNDVISYIYLGAVLGLLVFLAGGFLRLVALAIPRLVAE